MERDSIWRCTRCTVTFIFKTCTINLVQKFLLNSADFLKIIKSVLTGNVLIICQVKGGNDEIDLLMVAGGGGGLAHRNTYTDPLQLDPAGHKFKNPGQGYSGFTNPNGAG